MDIAGLGKRVQIFLDEDDALGGTSVYSAILEKLRAHGAAGATVTRGVAGFGTHGTIHWLRGAQPVSGLPIVVTWIDAPDRVERLLPALRDMVPEGLITIEDVEVVKYPHRDLPSLRAALRVGDLMTRDVDVARPDMPLPDVVEMLIGREFRSVPVVDERGSVVGIITNQDLVERGDLSARVELLATMEPVARRSIVRAAGSRTARDVMTADVATVSPDLPIEGAAELMVTRRLKRLPVVDSEGRLIGVISRADILRAVGEGYPAPALAAGQGKTPRRVGDVMNRRPPVVAHDAPLNEVLDVVVSTRLNRAVVVDAGHRVIGLISDADVLAKLGPRLGSSLLGALMHRGDRVPDAAASATAAEIMASPVATATVDMPIDAATRLMMAERRKILPVVDEAGVLRGVVDRADLLEATRLARRR